MRVNTTTSFLVSIIIVSFLSVLIIRDIPQVRVSGALQALQLFADLRFATETVTPSDAFLVGYQSMSTLRRSRSSTSGTWREIGPHNFGGRTISLAINHLNPNTIYAGSASGGLWVSYSAGEGAAAWKRINTGYPASSIASIAISPMDTSTLYIGTGEVYAYKNSIGGVAIRETRGFYGIGILKSIDAGKTWSKSLDWSRHQERGVWVVKINPYNTNTIWAGTTEGVFRSYNAGETWDVVNTTTMVMDLIINPNDTSEILIACGNLSSFGTGIYRTTNSGASWMRAASNLPASWGGKAQFAHTGNKTDTIYVSIGNSYQSSDAATWLCMSPDFGTTWNIISTEDYSSYQGWFAHFAVPHRKNKNLILTAGVDVFKSTDAGASFNQKSYWYAWDFGKTPIGGPEGPPDYSHADHHCFAYHPNNPEIIYFGNDGGVFRTKDFGESFEGLNGGYQTQQFYAGFSTSDTDSLWSIGGMQDNATVIYDGTLNWTRVIGGDGSWTSIDKNNNAILYASSQYLNIYRSSDFGTSWANVNSPKNGIEPFIAPFVTAYNNTAIVYTGSDRVFKSTNFGSSFAPNSVRLSTNTIYAMDVAQSDDNILYVTTAPINAPAEVFKTTNGGSSWSLVSSGLPNRYLTNVVIHPTNPDKVYITVAGYGTPHLYYTNDGGSTWQAIENGIPDLPTFAIELDPANPDVLYLGNEVGVLRSTDGGVSWENFSNGLPEVLIVYDLEISSSNRSMRCVTHGNGVFEMNLPDVILTDEEFTNPNKFSLEQNYPNPFNPSTVISFLLPKSSNITLTLYSATGELLQTLTEGYFSSGEHHYRFNAKNLSSGVYIYSLSVGSKSLSRKMMILK